MSEPLTTDRRLASDSVHERLRGDILDGRLRPGDALPSERTLSGEHGVNRHAVREAVKRLQQAGLVRVSHGGATRVLDWRATGGLDLLADLSTSGQGLDLLRSIAEMRASIGADAARLCARRAPAAARDELRRLASPYAGSSYEEQLLAYEQLWELIVDGSGNLGYRLAFNSLVGARHGRGVDSRIYADEVADTRAWRALAAAVADGNEHLAERTARELLDRTLEAVG
ncbi:MAG: FadR/GntR family transcriptional regulator [Thermoleophilaceae bacterium]